MLFFCRSGVVLLVVIIVEYKGVKEINYWNSLKRGRDVVKFDLVV